MKMYGYLMADFLHGQKRSSCKKTKDEIYQSSNFKSNFNPKMVKFTEDILKNIDTKLFFDARSKIDFSVEKLQNRELDFVAILYKYSVYRYRTRWLFYQRKLKEFYNQEQPLILVAVQA
jgi:hypothetical protein